MFAGDNVPFERLGERDGRAYVVTAQVRVRVSPGARQDAIVGWRGDVLRVRVKAPPERGRANDAVCRLIARALGLRANAVSVAHGAASRDKALVVEGMDDVDVRRRLSAPLL